MSELLTFVVLGLTAGAVYSLAGVGLVLTYRTSGVLNFGHGALATVSAYVFYELHVLHEMPWGWAAFISVLGVGPVLGLLLEFLARALQRENLPAQVAATVGLLLVVQAVVTVIYGTLETRTVPGFLDFGTVEIAGAVVTWSDIITIGIGVVVTLVLSWYLKIARFGIAMRAVVDDPQLLDTAGTSPVAVRRVAWVIGSTLAAASGVLFAPLLPLDPVQLTLLVIAAYGAAAVGGFRSLSLTFVGGLVIGVLASLATRYFNGSLLSGIAPSVPFLALFAVLLLFPKSKLPRALGHVVRGVSTWKAPTGVQVSLAAVVLAVFVTAPWYAGIHLTDWTVALATIVLLLSLGLLVRMSGQVSLCHISFAAIGAAAMSHLAVDHHVPWLLAVLLAGLIAVPVGALLAIPAIRLSGIYLAMATFGFGILLQYMFYTEPYMFGSNGIGITVPRPHLSWLPVDTDQGFYYVVLALSVAAVGLVLVLGMTRLGRLLRGMAEAPASLATSGTAVNVTRVLVFCLSAFLAAVGGALAGAAHGTVTSEAYPPLQSLVLLALIVIITPKMPWTAVVAGALMILVPSYVTGPDVPTYLQLLFGLSAMGMVFVPEAHRHLPPALTAALDRLRRAQRPRTIPIEAPDGHPRREPPRSGKGSLTLTGLRVQFGGVVAVRDIDLTAPAGRVTGLIGPNGAGKTSTFNACSGLVKPRRGKVFLDGRDVSGLGPSRRARAGLGRTFQRMQLFDSLSVYDNVALGAEAARAGANPFTHVIGRPAQRRAAASRTVDAIRLCGLAEVSDVPVSLLSTGQRRLVDLARCLAGEFTILLLDEPSSGLDSAETRRFAEILTRVVDERGVGVLLVEHDLSLVLEVCRHIYVLDFGEMIFNGTSAEVVASPVVQAAYLGDAAGLGIGAAEAASGVAAASEGRQGL